LSTLSCKGCASCSHISSACFSTRPQKPVIPRTARHLRFPFTPTRSYRPSISGAGLAPVLDFCLQSRTSTTAETWNFGLRATRSREPRQARKGATVPGKPSVPRRSRSSSSRRIGISDQISATSDQEAVGCHGDIHLHVPNEIAKHIWLRSFEPLRSGSQDDSLGKTVGVAKAAASCRIPKVLTFAGRTPKMNPPFAESPKAKAPRHV